MEAYFDNSATTIVTDSVKDIVVKTMTEDFGNPSAMHMVGVKAEKYIKEAQENIAKILKVDPKEIFFFQCFHLYNAISVNRQINNFKALFFQIFHCCKNI